MGEGGKGILGQGNSKCKDMVYLEKYNIFGIPAVEILERWIVGNDTADMGSLKSVSAVWRSSELTLLVLEEPWKDLK